MSPHDFSSIVPPTTSSTCSPFISQPIGPDDGPSASSPHPTPKEAPYPSGQVNEDMSDLCDSEPDDAFSPILNSIITIPIPQNATEVEELMRQAVSKRKSALHKFELADAALQEALVKKRLCRSRAQHAKRVLDASSIYVENVEWTIQQSKHESVLSKHASPVITLTKPVVHIINIPGGTKTTSMAIILD